MFARSSFFFALRVFAVVGSLIALGGLVACGRSDLDDYLIGDAGSVVPDSGRDVPDVQTDNAACNATTCPTGCCDPDGQCAPGSDDAECGTLGQSCANCQAEGFQLCDPTRHACGNTVASCDPETCSGCCEGNVCFAGTDPNECGLGGQSCLDCVSSGLACVDAQCVPPGCGPANCSGCCFGEECVTGTDQTACGDQGEACDNCLADGQTCVPQPGSGGTCVNVASCNGTNCTGCCSGTSCLPGIESTACGAGGNACADCTASNEMCILTILGGQVGGQCGTGPPTCDATSCQGCCDLADTCQPGFIDTQCGQNGTSCDDCTQLAPPSTCDLGVSPRTCQSQQMQCPAPYATCPPSLETPSPTKQAVCTASELQNAAAACQGGAHSTVCDSFFAFENANDPNCAACLGAFDFDFTELTGVATCVAPFADAACNHSTACVVDCTDQSCAQCTDAVALQQCEAQAPVGTCSSYFDDAQCIAGAFLGAGSFCAPNQGGQFGDWLSVVGQFYCGPAQ